jgi:serine kinase of HPr protein (carbohydrate metabolism regulator)
MRRSVLLMANNGRNLISIRTSGIINAKTSMMWVIHIEQVTSLLSVVLTAEENIDFFERNMLSLGNEDELLRFSSASRVDEGRI